MSNLCCLVDPLERLGLKPVSPWIMASVLANTLFMLHMKHAHIVGVKGGEMKKCSREKNERNEVEKRLLKSSYPVIESIFTYWGQIWKFGGGFIVWVDSVLVLWQIGVKSKCLSASLCLIKMQNSVQCSTYLCRSGTGEKSVPLSCISSFEVKKAHRKMYAFLW